jgi:hypothetical protein
MTFYWASQLDVEHGYWATPWPDLYYDGCRESLATMIEVAFAGLRRCIELQDPHLSSSTQLNHEFRHTKLRDEIVLADLWNKLRKGGHTWPPYAINARGGTLDPHPHQIIKFAVFEHEDDFLPPIFMLRPIREACETEREGFAHTISQDETIEIAYLDYWLSWAAKTASIASGSLNVLKYAPAIVEDMYNLFMMHGRDIRYSQREEGDEKIRSVAFSISRSLSEVQHTLAEEYFIWVAFLRTVKVVRRIVQGTDTDHVQKILQEDTLVYLA